MMKVGLQISGSVAGAIPSHLHVAYYRPANEAIIHGHLNRRQSTRSGNVSNPIQLAKGAYQMWVFFRVEDDNFIELEIQKLIYGFEGTCSGNRLKQVATVKT
jgi:hypothetical protein